MVETGTVEAERDWQNIMAKTEAVDEFMDKLDHPLKAEVQAIREIIKGVHPRITEEIKWNAPSFSYKDYIATFNLRERKRVHLVFHNPRIAEVQSDLLEGDYKDRRMAYFSGMSDVQAKRAALEEVVRGLVRLMDEDHAKTEVEAEPESDLPKLSAPARRALAAAGYVRLEQFTRLTENEVLQLHGMGPKALEQIRRALADKGLAFSKGK